MKRLIKKANVQLSHSTTFDVFLKILQSGSILPYSEINEKNRRSYSSSLDENSIYLSDDSYEYDFIDSDSNKIGVTMLINAREENLQPSYDYKEYVFPEEREDGTTYYVDENGTGELDEDNLTWSKTINLFNECRHVGPISLNDVDSVRFVTSDTEMSKAFGKFRQGLSLEDARKFANEIVDYLT